MFGGKFLWDMLFFDQISRILSMRIWNLRLELTGCGIFSGMKDI